MPIIYVTIKASDDVQNHLPTSIDAFLLNAADVLAVADFIHSNSAEDDLVIASAPIAAILERPSADFQMAVVAMGFDAIHLPHDLPPDRFAFNSNFQLARYVVVDNLWRNWGAVHMPAVISILETVEQWELVFETGAIQVYENPEQ